MRRSYARILSALIVLLAASAQAATRQVNGGSGCSDTTGNPYCTINKAILAAADGDTIEIASGTYAGTIASFSKPLLFAGAGSGTSGTVITKPITYTGTGPLSFSNLRIQGGGTNLKVGGTGNFSGLTLTGAAFVGNGNGAHGVFIKQNGSASNVTVTNCTFTNHGQSGLLIQKGTGATTNVDHVTVTGSTFDGNGEYGLRIDPRATNVHIQSSNVTNNAIDGLLFLSADGVALDNLTITGNRNGILLIPLLASESIANVTLTNVDVSHNTKFISGQSGSGLTLSGGNGSITNIIATNSTFSSNTIHGVSATGAVSGVEIGCSIITANGQDGIHNASSPSAEVRAENVYWGCPSGPGSAGCSTVSGSVDFTPYRGSAAAACTPPPALVGIAVTPSPLSIAQGATAQLTATGTYDDASTADLTASALWASSNGSVATVTSGLVSGVASGSATITASAGAITGDASITVQAAETLPPDPSLVAPPNDPTIATTVYDSTAFLYSGADPIQTGVAPGTIQRERAAVLRGRVLDRNGAALGGVRVRVLDHPELGQTLSRADGWFDLAANGGGPLVLVYERNGYLAAQRQVRPGWNDWTVAAEVRMTPLDANVTSIASGAGTYQVARGSTVADERGLRQQLVLFRPSTAATMVLPDGSSQPLESLHVRITEYTVGEQGIDAMPAPLPPESGYTYCVELSADEAIAAGAASVTFSQPVIAYVENLIGLPVGANVPTGYYDRQRGVWVAAPDGRVIQIVMIVEGRAYVDIDGDGVDDDPTALSAIGMTTAEREQLATLYGAGQKLWRTELDHFTPVDHNEGLMPTGQAPNGPPPAYWIPARECNECPGSIIGVEDQTLGERLGLTGTPFSISYNSRRAPGFLPGYRVKVNVSGNETPLRTKRIEVTMNVAGRTMEFDTAAAANLEHELLWDGRDAYGRPVQGGVLAAVGVAYVSDGVWVNRTLGNYTFADFSRMLVASGLPAPSARSFEVRQSQGWQVPLGNWQADTAALGGWTLDVHHAYDPVRQVVELGDGGQQRAQAIGPVATTVLDGVFGMRAIAAAADGSLYIAFENGISRRAPDGTMTQIAGDGTPVQFDEDGYDQLTDGPALERPVAPQDLALGRDGAVYYSDINRVRKVSGGTITTIAGNGFSGNSDEEGIATALEVHPQGLAASPDGSVVFIDGNRLRRVSTAGRLATIAGQASAAPGTPAAVGASLGSASGVAIGPSGNLYVTDPNHNETRRITPQGNIDPYGPSEGSFNTDLLGSVAGIAVDEDEEVYTPTHVTHLNGESERYAGGSGDSREGALALSMPLNSPRDVTIGPDGSRYLLEEFSFVSSSSRIVKIGPSLPGLGISDIAVPSADGSELYLFNFEGRHLRTLNAVTGTVRYQFAYNAKGRLTTITDVDGNVTTIERNALGKPLAIVSSGGQRTSLALNGDGFLQQLTNPASEDIQLAYWPGGLLHTVTDPNGHASTFDYDATGRLTKDTNAAGGFTALARSGTDGAYTVITTSAEGRQSQYSIANGTEQQIGSTTIDSAGLRIQTFEDGHGHTTIDDPSGVHVNLTEKADPDHGMNAPLQTWSISTGTHNMLMSRFRDVQRSDPEDPLSPITQVGESLTINGRQSLSIYNVGSRTLETLSPEGRSEAATFDARDHVSSVTVPGLTPATFTHDGRGRLVTIAQGIRQTTFGYDSANRLQTITDPLLRTVTFTYDDADRVTRQTLADGREIGFTYDAGGNVSAVSPPSRPTHLFTFTPADQTDTYTPPTVNGGGATHYEYNLDGQLTNVLRPDGKTIALSYDGAGRTSSIAIERGSITLAYDDGTGHIQSMTTPEGESIGLTFSGTLLTETTWTGSTNAHAIFGYDTELRLSEETIACSTATNLACSAIAYQYDQDDLLTHAGALQLSRDPQNALLQATSAGAVSDSWSYNGYGEPTDYAAQWSGENLYVVHDERDGVGRVTQRVETFGGEATTKEYGYDTTGRLEQVKVDNVIAASYTYDGNGNRLTKVGADGPHTATYDSQDRLLTYDDTTYAYTANGEMTAMTDSSGPTSYVYDELGNLLRVTKPNGDVIEYVIDAASRRIGKKMNGTIVQRWVYTNRLSPAAEIDGDGNVIARYVYATRSNAPDVIVRGDTTYRLLADSLGSPRLVVDTDTGSIIQRVDYDEFGNVLSDSNPGFQPFGFAGGLYDRDTGLVRFGARDYDPRAGRWTTKDPIGFAGEDTNSFAYSFSDPVNIVDVSGLSGKLTIYSSGKEGSSDTIVAGHSWIVFTPDGQSSESYGTYGITVGGPPRGVVSDWELTHAGKYDGFSDTTASRTTWIDDAGEKRLRELIDSYKKKGDDAWTMKDPCSGFAVQAWKAATGERLSHSKAGQSNPTSLRESIRKLNGGLGAKVLKLSPARGIRK